MKTQLAILLLLGSTFAYAGTPYTLPCYIGDIQVFSPKSAVTRIKKSCGPVATEGQLDSMPPQQANEAMYWVTLPKTLKDGDLFRFPTPKNKKWFSIVFTDAKKSRSAGTKKFRFDSVTSLVFPTAHAQQQHPADAPQICDPFAQSIENIQTAAGYTELALLPLGFTPVAPLAAWMEWQLAYLQVGLAIVSWVYPEMCRTSEFSPDELAWHNHTNGITLGLPASLMQAMEDFEKEDGIEIISSVDTGMHVDASVLNIKIVSGHRK